MLLTLSFTKQHYYKLEGKTETLRNRIKKEADNDEVIQSNAFYYEPYVVHSGFPHSPSDTSTGPLHMIPHSYTECYSAGLWEEQDKDTHTHEHRPALGFSSVYPNTCCRLYLRHQQN